MQAEALNVSNAIKIQAFLMQPSIYYKNSMLDYCKQHLFSQHSTIQNGSTNLDRLSTDTMEQHNWKCRPGDYEYQ